MTPLNGLRCDLGEGAFWHPGREEFFWFDITARQLHSVARSWTFEEMVSAAGWVDQNRLLLASETRLFVHDVVTGVSESLCALDADQKSTRSNDGRADMQGGFWIGTMGKRAGKGEGAIWRWYKGELRRLFPDITIPNALCFPADGKSACFTDTPTRQVMRVALDGDGWPIGKPEIWLDLNAEGLNPDGAVIDANGVFWVAQWGASRVAAYALDGQFLRKVSFPAAHTSCPAFGGVGLTDLYCTTAREGHVLPSMLDGAVFVAKNIGTGRPENRVKLDR